MALVELACLLCSIGVIGFNTQSCAALHYPVPQNVDWNKMARDNLEANLNRQKNENLAKNVILFIGDGMGVSTITGARIAQGQSRSRSGEEEQLSFEKFPYVSLIKTYNVDHQVPDSAGTATAILCGEKTNYMVIGVNENVAVNDCAAVSGNQLDSILTWAYNKGKSTGLISTSEITDATPASAYAHCPNRYWASSVPAEHHGQCEDIAHQLIHRASYINVILGGGRARFYSTDVEDAENSTLSGMREDGRNLVQEWQLERHREGASHQYVWNTSSFAAVDPASTDYLLGLFAHEKMHYEADRRSDIGGEPHISEMLEKAIEILGRNPNGYVLLVEGGRIDHAHHINNARRAMIDTAALAEAVERADKLTDQEDTLLVVTADHSHVFTIGGYPGRGNSLYGLQDNDKQPADDGLPYTTLSYANGPGEARSNLTNANVESVDFRQQPGIRSSYETHGGEDVALFASGAWAHLFSGVQEQNYIAHAIAYAACLGEYDKGARCLTSAGSSDFLDKRHTFTVIILVVIAYWCK